MSASASTSSSATAAAAAAAKPAKVPVPSEPYLLITVGTTRFDALIAALVR